MKRKWIWVAIALAALAAAAAAWYFIVVDNIADEVIIEAGSQPVASDWLIRDLGIGAELALEPGADVTKPGLYDVTLLYMGRSRRASLRVRDTLAPQGKTQPLTAWSTKPPQAGDFITQITDFTDVTVAFKAQPDVTVDGAQTVTLLLTDEGGNVTELTAELTLVQDHTAPVIGGVSQRVCYAGREVDFLAGITVTDDHDADPALTVDHSAVDLQKAGEYDIRYTATDAAGNAATVVAGVTVVEDNQAPTVLGVSQRSLCVGSTIAYRSGVVVRDDKDAAPVLTVDSSKVDLSQPGEYPLVYIATDAAGNETRVETTVTVHPKIHNYVDEEEIWAYADRIIERLELKGMDTEAQVRAIYYWVQHSFFYIHDTDAIDWKQSAYNMLQDGQGDCYSFFSVSKLLFERLGIPNMDVKRLRLPNHTSDHYWSMVSVDGGENWYHYDPTPNFALKERFCLVTDAYLAEFSARYNNYYHRDFDSLPKTPEQAP